MCFFKKKKNSKQCINEESGFSLVELSLVVGVIGLLAIGSISVFSEQKTHVQWKESDLKLQFIKKALINHVAFNKFLPCPDVNEDGFENRSPDGSCVATGGDVPFLTLNLSEDAIRDSWGNHFRYEINRDAVNLANMTNCPMDTACFFNNMTPPAFDLTTLPVMGNPGNNNLRVCLIANCNIATAGVDIEGDDFVAVLIAFNENGQENDGLAQAEDENRDGDQFFVQANYSEAPYYYDDLIQTISANELKKRFDLEVVIEEVEAPSGNNINKTVDINDSIAGGAGDNNRFSENIGVNVVTKTMGFGEKFAGKTVTLTFDAIIEGGWEDRGKNGGPIEYHQGVAETQDRFLVGLNGGDVSDLKDVEVNLEEGVARFDDHQVTESFYYDENVDGQLYGELNNTWYEYLSFDVDLDSSGNLKIDLAVFSTHVSEKVTVENMKAVLYLAPPSIPSFPGIQAIDGIPQTAGLESSAGGVQ